MKLRYIFAGLMALAATATLSAATEIDANLCDPDATQGAKDMYAWMRNEVWGKKTISGAHAEWDYNTKEADRYKELAGKLVKINIYDFQHFNADWCDYRGSSAADWQTKGGIVGFMWHWQAFKTPFTCHEDNRRGFGSPSGNSPTYFHPKYATVEGTLENRILKEDLDKIKDHLLYYQEKGLTVIWRPFHEAAGNSGNLDSGNGAWFWWGVDGPVHFRRLWNYVQDYLWKAGVHNLIYVWTSQTNDVRWYPGDDRVDIVGRDNYDKDSHASKKADFDNLRTLWPNKMAALAECGTMPDPDNMIKDDAMWLYVAPWCGTDYVPAQNDAEFLKKFFNHPSVITQ